jgi:hypothetical protein
LERSADRALYAAKNRGRDRVEVATRKESEDPESSSMDGDADPIEGNGSSSAGRQALDQKTPA